MNGPAKVCCLVLLAVSAGLTAQTPAAQTQTRTLAVLDFVPLTPGANPALASAFSDSIALDLAQAGYRVLAKASVRAAVAAWPDPKRQSLSKADAVALAASLGADAVVTGFYGFEGKVLTAGVRAYDVLSGRLAVVSVEEGESGLAVFSTIDAMAQTVVDKVRQRLPDLSPQEVVVRKEKITVQTVIVEQFVEKGVRGGVTLESPMEGAGVWAGERLLGAIHGGKLAVDVKLGVPLVVVQRLAGWYDRTTVLASPQDGGVYPLGELYRVGGWEASAAWTPATPLGAFAGGSWHLLPDTLTIDFDAAAFAVSSEFPATSEAPLFGFYRGDLGFTYRFFPADFPFRMGVGLSVMAHAFVPTAVLYQVGVGPVLRAEYNAPRWRLYTEVRGMLPVLGGNYSDPSFSLGSALVGGFAWKF